MLTLTPINSTLPYRPETVATSVGATVFVVTTVALVILVGLQVNLGVGSFCAIHGIEIAGFVVFAVAFSLRRKNLNESIERAKSFVPSEIESLSTLAAEIPMEIPPEIEVSGALPPASLTLDEFTLLVTNNLKELQISLTNLLVGFAGAYERSCGRRLNPKKIQTSLSTIFTTLIQIINDKKQLAKTAFVLTAREYLVIEHLISEEDRDCLHKLPTALKIQDSQDPACVAFSDLMRSFSKIHLDSEIKKTLQNLRKKTTEVKDNERELGNVREPNDNQKAQEKLQKAQTAQQQAFSEFLEILYSKANLSETKTQAFLELLFASKIAPSLREIDYLEFPQAIEKMVKGLKDHYTKTFNDSVLQKAVWTGSTAIARQVWYYYINSALFSAGLSEIYKEALKCRYGLMSGPIDTLLSELVNPFYRATFDQNHLYRQGLESLVRGEIAIPAMNEASLDEAIRVSLSFLNTVTEKLNGMKFA